MQLLEMNKDNNTIIKTTRRNKYNLKIILWSSHNENMNYHVLLTYLLSHNLLRHKVRSKYALNRTLCHSKL